MSRHPNVLMVITDHTRAEALRPDSPCRTPYLDALAAEGVRFERTYTINAICSPSRASLMTGLYPSSHGVWDCTHTQQPGWVDLRTDAAFWSQHLRDTGYRMGYFGKWHVETSKRLDRFGFDVHEITQDGWRHTCLPEPRLLARTPGYDDRPLAGVGREDGEPRHPAFDRGIEFIRGCAGGGQPFCCVVSTTEPHDPYEPPERFFRAYDAGATPLPATLRTPPDGKPPVIARMRDVWAGLTDEHWRLLRTAYYASVSFLDHEVGRILEALRGCGAYDDTIVLFLADHGDMLGGHGLFAKGVTPYEEVYNIPLVIRVPGLAGRGSEPRALASTVDLAPTLVDLCGAAPLPRAQGRSLRPVLEGAFDAAQWQDAYAEYYGQRFVQTQRIVWHGDWKYVFSPTGIDELYHLGQDPHERRNLAADPAHRGTLEEMARRMWRQIDRIGDASIGRSHYPTLRIAPVGPLDR